MPPRSERPRRSGPSASTVNSMATSTASTSSSLSNSTSNQQDGTMQVNVTALSSALFLAVQKAVQDALQPPPSITTSTNATSTSTVVSAHVPTTASIVQDSIVQATQAIAGTYGGNIVSPSVHSMPTTPLFSSVAIPLGSAVSDKLKSKIWANEFVHLGALLQTAVQQERFTVGLSATGNGNKPQITLEPASAPRKLNSIQQWVTAFHTFMAIYCQKFAGDTAALLKYCETVRAIANKNGNWAYYDEQFRYLRQSAPDRYPWEEVQWELWLEATSVNLPFRPQRGNLPAGRVGRFRQISLVKGTCFNFNNGRFCLGCSFNHICSRCGGKHAARNCSEGGEQPTSSIKPSGTTVASASTREQSSHPRKN